VIKQESSGPELQEPHRRCGAFCCCGSGSATLLVSLIYCIREQQKRGAGGDKSCIYKTIYKIVESNNYKNTFFTNENLKKETTFSRQILTDGKVLYTVHYLPGGTRKTIEKIKIFKQAKLVL
jgi:hypothetical protein